MLARELPDGLGRRRAEQGPRRGHDRHPQGLPRGHPVGGRPGARAGRRLGRPRAVDADADRRRRRRRARAPTTGATCTSASASTAWARSSTASCCSGFRAFGAGFLIFSDYMKGSIRLAAIMRIPSVVRLHARLDRPRRGRPDAPADRAARDAARDARTSTSCGPRASTRPRCAWRYALRQTDRRPCSRCRARACRSGTRPASPTTRSSAAPTCCTTPTAATRS